MVTRKKAQDIFAESELIFASKTSSFDKACPEIENISVEVEEKGKGSDYRTLGRDNVRRMQYGKNTFPGEYINCSNYLCYGGGVHIGQIVRSMVWEKNTQYDKSLRCRGYEGSPKGRKKYGPCFTRFRVRITLSLKEK